MASGVVRVAIGLAGSPVFALQALAGAKSFEANPLIGSERLNRWGLHAARVRLAHRLAGERRARLAARLSEADRAAFDADGFVVRADFLPPELFEALRERVRRHPGPFRERREGGSILRKVHVTPAVRRRIPELERLCAMADWRGLIAYAGARDARPELFLQAVLQDPSAPDEDPQTRLHADTFHPTVKAWLYLTESDAGTGPLTYVPGSHRLTAARLAWEREMSARAGGSRDPETREGSFRVDPETLAAMGLPSPVAITARPNTLVVADTFGFHARGRSRARALRAEIWAIGPRNPFLPWPCSDRLAVALTASEMPRRRWISRRGASFLDADRGPLAELNAAPEHA